MALSPPQKTAAEFALCQGAEKSGSFIWPTTISRAVWRAESDFFSIPFTWMTGYRQPSTDLGLCGEIAGQPGAPFVFSPSSCLHSYTFKWAMHAWLRSSRKATWYEWGFLSPFFPAWRNLNERSSLLLWDKMCLVVLQDYLWSECQQET